jgi:hypothetical protein
MKTVGIIATSFADNRRNTFGEPKVRCWQHPPTGVAPSPAPRLTSFASMERVSGRNRGVFRSLARSAAPVAINDWCGAAPSG